MERELWSRLHFAYEEIEARAQRTRHEESQFASQGMFDLHSRVRHEASQVMELMSSTLNAEHQLRNAEFIVERELNSREGAAFRLGFSRAVQEATANHERIIGDVRSQAQMQFDSAEAA
ncbi:MAG: hypothetical protein ACKPKO_31960, partial [Candidatus Fonsibacter sp.]